jgi:D-alanine transaminase
MVRCIYVNGRYRRYDDAHVHAEDRGFQFGDGVYEVIEVRDHALVDATRHLARLHRSLSELAIPAPMADDALRFVFAQVVRRNRVRDGIVYVQVTRGAAPRDFALTPPDHPPTVVCLARPISRAAVDARARTGIAVKTLPDTRWARCDLKTVMLLPSVLAKAAAKAEGAGEAWFVDPTGYVTEGASSNAWIVTSAGELITRPKGNDILAGVTRATVMDVARAVGLSVIERPFQVAEIFSAREAFLTSASTIVMPVVRVDGKPIGDGRPGPSCVRLRTAFHDIAETRAI